MQPSLQTQLAQGMMGNSPMNIQSPSAPTYQPSLTTPAAPPMPDKTYQVSQGALQAPQQLQSPQGQMITLPTEDRDPQAEGTQVSLSEAEKIIAALEGRLKNISKVEQMQQQAQMPPQPQGV